jgi:hypothetical protein
VLWIIDSVVKYTKKYKKILNCKQQNKSYQKQILNIKINSLFDEIKISASKE